MLIEDGTGTGKTLHINSRNRAAVDSVTETKEHHVNHDLGEAYNALFNQTPTGAGDMFFYLKNTAEEDIIIEGVWLASTTAEQVYYNIGDTGTPVNGSTLTPANLNAGSGKTADVTCEQGVNITGLSGGSTIQKIWVGSAISTFFNAEQDIVVPKNQTFTMWATAGSINIRGTLVFNFSFVS